LEAQPVYGYYTEWRNVRVAINSYGKLADRNRNFIIFLETTKANTPRNFVELEKNIYDICTSYYAAHPNGKMCEPYTEATEYINAAIRQHERQLEQSTITPSQN
jgi:hypothetical protein